MFCNQVQQLIITPARSTQLSIKPVTPPYTGPVTPEIIIRIVCDVFNTRKVDITGRGRKRDEVDPKHTAMWIIRMHTQLSLKKIGKLFNKAHHSTVIYALKKVDDLFDTNKDYRAKFNAVNDKIIELKKTIQEP